MEKMSKDLTEKFENLNDKINSLINETHLKSDLFIAKIENKISFSELIDGLNFARNFLLDILSNHQKLILKKLNSIEKNPSTNTCSIKKLFYIENSVIKTLANFYILKLIDHIFNRNNLYIRFKYFKLCYNATQQVNLHYGLNENLALKKNKIVLSKQRTFYFSEFPDKTCYMLIRDDLRNLDLVKSPTIYLRCFENYQFLAYDIYIVGLFYDDYSFVVKLYKVKDENFTLISSKTFKFKIFLHSINKYEIVCLTNQINSNRYLALNYDLNKIDSFGQKVDEKRPFYFGDGSLINCSFNKIFIYFYDRIKQRHAIKILNRSSGMLEKFGFIDLPEFTKFNQIKIDSSFRILILDEINSKVTTKKRINSLNYFDANGKLLFKIKSNLFRDLKSFDLTSEDHLYFIDYNNNKINFF